MTPHPFLVALALLAGCSLGPDYARPDAEVPAAYRATAQTAAQAWPDNGWWRGFGSLELNGLIDAARAQNFDLAAAVARVRQADAQLRVSGSALLPTADVQGRQDWSRSAGSGRGFAGVSRGVRYTETRTTQLSLGISWELDFWGRLRATRDVSLANALASRFDQQTVALTVVTSVASTWFQACALRDRLDVSARNLADAEFILRAITARQAAGTATLLDVSQQEALVAAIRTTQPGLRSQLEQQVNALGLLTGRPPSTITLRPGTLVTLRLPEVASGVPSELLARRPDVATAEAQLQAANANIRVARANFYPSVTLSGSAGWSSLALGTLFGPGSLFASAAANAAQTVFDNGLRTAQFDQSRARYDELLADYRTAVLQAFTDVEDGIQTYGFATEQQRLSEKTVSIAQRSADIARAQLLAGTVDIVTALQVQTTLFNNLDTLAQIRLSRFQALLSLYKALGGGWTDRDVKAPETRLFQGVL